MENNKLTVEWLAKSYVDLLTKLNNEEISLKEFEIQYIELLDKAKEMEKERAIKFACDVHMNVKKDKVKSLMQLVDEKYNENYGGGEQ